MAFTQFHLTKSINQSQGIFDKYLYRTEETIADVLVSGYFRLSRFKRDEFDQWAGGYIDVECSDGYFVGQISEDGDSVAEVLSGSGGGGGGVQSVTGGDNVTVSGTASDPVINVPNLGVESVVAGTNVTVDDTDPANLIISATGGASGVQSVVAGDNILVDDTDADNPIVGHDPSQEMFFNEGTGVNFGDHGSIYSDDDAPNFHIDAEATSFVNTEEGIGQLRIVPPANGNPPWIDGHWVSGEFNVGISGIVNPAAFSVIDAGGGSAIIRMDYAFWPENDGTAGQLLSTNADGTLSWVSGGAGGASTFLELTDTPADYTGSEQLAPVVNVDEDGLEFGANLFNGISAQINFATGASGGANILNNAVGPVSLGNSISGQINALNSADDISLANSRNGELIAFDYAWPVGSAVGVLTNDGTGQLSWEASGGGTLQDLQSVLEEGSHALIEIPEASSSITYDDGTSSSSVFEIDSGDIKSEVTNTLTPSIQGTDASALSARLYYSNTSTEQTNSVTVSAAGIDISPSTGPITLDYADWPASDGPADSLLMTDGAGQLSWSTVPATLSTDPLNPPIIARYRARFSSPGTQTIASSTGSEALIFGEELEDTAGISSDGTTFTAPPGTTAVEIKAQATWNSNGNAGLRQIFLWQNGGFAEQQVGDRDTGVSTSLNQRNLFSSPRLPCSAGDTFQIRANQNSSANANVTSENNATWVELEFYG